MVAAIPAILQYGVPLAVKGVTLLAGYIAGRIHQAHINKTAPKAPPTQSPS